MNIYNLKQRFYSIGYGYVKKVCDESLLKYCTYILKRNELERLTLVAQESGISGNAGREDELIVSLTTHGSRYYDVFLAIESIMQGTVRPDRIILWAPEELKTRPIPETLRRQVERGLEIRFVKDVRSFTKLIYAIREFPDSNIITIDDDVLYPVDTMENLANAHKESGNKICANDYLIVPEQFESKDRPFMEWDRPHRYLECSSKCIFEGFAGVLYPPRCLSEEVFREDVFLKICGTSDDIWFSAMAMLNGTECIYSCPHSDGFRLVSNYSVQDSALSIINSSRNQPNIREVFRKYSLF